MITVAAIADTHANERVRWDEHCRIMTWLADDAEQRGVDLVLHAGDIYDAASTPAERVFIAEWSRRVASGRPLVFVAGNHDRQNDVSFLSRLRSDHEIIADESPRVHAVAGVAVATLPWPRRASLLASIGHPVSKDESNATASQHLRNVVSGLGDVLELYETPRVLLAHAMINGARTNHEQPPLVGLDMSVSAHDLALSRAHFVAVGHVHAENEWDIGGIPVVYPGSPYHTDFGNSGPTSYLIAEFEDHGPLIRWYRVPTPARQMILWEVFYEPETPVGPSLTVKSSCGGPSPHGMDLTGAEIRLRYETPNEHRVAARAKAEELKRQYLAAGAHSVKLEEQVQVSTRARVPDIATAKTTAEKLEAYWNAKGAAPDSSTKERLLGRLAELEEAARMCARTVARAINCRLVEKGLILKTRGRQHTANVYRFNVGAIAGLPMVEGELP